MESVQITASESGAELTISRIGFGCASLMRLPSARARRALIAAVLDTGVTHFDVARMYGLGAAESELGKALARRRDQVTIATKFGIDASALARRLAPLQGPARALLARSRAGRSAVRARREDFTAARRYDADRAQASLDTSLRQLGTDYVDVLFLHDPRPRDEIDVASLAEFLERSRDSGKIRAWGVSADSSAGLGVLERFGGPGILQMREDLLEPSPVHRSSIAFGALQWREHIVQWLESDHTAHRRWCEALTQDPLEDDRLTLLLQASALSRSDVRALLYSTTKISRLSALSRVVDRAPESPQLDAFRDCLRADRESIMRFGAR